MIVSFDVTPCEAKQIAAIVRRARALGKAPESLALDLLSLEMDLTTCHANGCPLRLGELLIADDFNFAHDVFGIRRHLNRETGKLENCFLPRFSAPQSKARAA